jgi:hypothetical protein
VDLVAIAPFYVSLAVASGGGGLAVLRVLRLARVFRVFRVGTINEGARDRDPSWALEQSKRPLPDATVSHLWTTL